MALSLLTTSSDPPRPHEPETLHNNNITTSLCRDRCSGPASTISSPSHPENPSSVAGAGIATQSTGHSSISTGHREGGGSAYTDSGSLVIVPHRSGSDTFELADYGPVRARKDAADLENRRQEKRNRKLEWLESRDEMKFSHSIQFNAVPDWSSHYIAYSNLKKLYVTSANRQTALWHWVTQHFHGSPRANAYPPVVASTSLKRLHTRLEPAIQNPDHSSSPAKTQQRLSAERSALNWRKYAHSMLPRKVNFSMRSISSSGMSGSGHR